MNRYEERLKEVLEGQFTCPNPLPPGWIEAAAKRGMLRKSDLVDGAYYYGRCRNADVAKWDATTQEFTYQRTKFGKTFPETIKHPEDDNGFDLFIPVEIAGPPIGIRE